MGKKDGNKKRKAEELAEDDENYVDPELQAEIAAVMAAREEARHSEENHNSSSSKEKTTYNKDGLIKSLESQPTELLPFRETYQICENSIIVQNENDDIEREMAFYNHTLLAVKTGRDKLEALGIPTIRPTDFFCESMKSDAHMTKIKDRLLIEAKRVESFELRKNREQNRKFNKQVSDLRKQEKSAERKQHNEELKKIKKAGDADEKEERLNKVLEDRPEKSKKRQNMDKKYGFGAKDRKMAKLNDRKSLNDLSDFNPRGGKFVRREKSKGSPHSGGGGGGSAGGGGGKEYSSFKRGRSGGGAAKNKKPNRPGKQTRQKNRAARSG